LGQRFAYFVLGKKWNEVKLEVTLSTTNRDLYMIPIFPGLPHVQLPADSISLLIFRYVPQISPFFRSRGFGRIVLPQFCFQC
jgi:hypothetical protein